MKLTKNKTGRFTIQNWLITFVVFAVAITFLFMFVNDMNSNYAFAGVDVQPQENVNTTVINDSIAELNNISDGMREAVLGKKVDTVDTVSSLFSGAFSALRFVSATFGMFGNLLNAFVESLHIPPIFVGFAMIAVVILIVMALISIIIRFRD